MSIKNPEKASENSGGSWWDWLDVYSTRQLVYKAYFGQWKCLRTLGPWTKAEAQLRLLQPWRIKCPWGCPGESLQLRLGLLVVFNQIYLSLPIRKKHLGVKKHKTERKWKISKDRSLELKQMSKDCIWTAYPRVKQFSMAQVHGAGPTY